MNIIDLLGGPTEVAKMVGVKSPSVHEWKYRNSIPHERCPAIEFATAKRGVMVSVETLRPDIKWVRVPDASWPHPLGKPLVDVMPKEVVA